MSVLDAYGGGDAGTDAAAGLSELQELWSTRLGSLETLVLSTKCDEASILKEMRKMGAALEAKLLDLDVDPDRVLGEVTRLRDEIVSMRLATGEDLSELFEQLVGVMRV